MAYIQFSTSYLMELQNVVYRNLQPACKHTGKLTLYNSVFTSNG